MAIRKFFDIASEMDNVISLGIGVPDFVTPDNITAAVTAVCHPGTSSSFEEIEEALTRIARFARRAIIEIGNGVGM